MAGGPTLGERHTYPLLTLREDWPPVDQKAPVDLTHAERAEFDRYWQDRRQDAEQAARSSFFEHKVPDWWATNFEERKPLPDIADVRSDVPWYKQPSYLRAETPVPDAAPPTPPDREWQQPSLEDFRQREGYDQFAEERLAYEQDLWRRATNMHRTRHENDLMKSAERSSPQMRKAVENMLFERRLAKLRADDDVKRIEAFEARLGHDMQEAYDSYLRGDGTDDNRYPVPGPYGRLESPAEKRDGQDRMLEDYHRDGQDEPER